MHPRYRIASSRTAINRRTPCLRSPQHRASRYRAPAFPPLPAPPAVPSKAHHPRPPSPASYPAHPSLWHHPSSSGRWRASKHPPAPRLALRLAQQPNEHRPASTGFSPASAHLENVPDFPPSPPACPLPHLQRIWASTPEQTPPLPRITLWLAGSIISRPPLEGIAHRGRGSPPSRPVLPAQSRPRIARARAPEPAHPVPLPHQSTTCPSRELMPDFLRRGRPPPVRHWAIRRPDFSGQIKKRGGGWLRASRPPLASARCYSAWTSISLTSWKNSSPMVLRSCTTTVFSLP